MRIDQSIIALACDLGSLRAGDPVSVAVRPEAISLEPQPGRESRLRGRIDEVSFLGSVIRVRVATGSNSVSLDTFNNPMAPPPMAGSTTELSFAQSDLLLLQD